MPIVFNARTLSISVDCPVHVAYAFLSNPENLPRWATAFCTRVVRDGNDWMVDAPAGPARVRFTAANELGALDHTVATSAGDRTAAPMRVVPNGAGSETIFTLFELKGMPDDQFAADAAMVQSDLERPRRVHEANT
jgi:hypothetical protein